MGFIGWFLLAWLGGIVLKMLGVPPFNEIGWGWFILAPILVVIFRVLAYVIMFAFYAALGIATVYYGAKLIIWIFAQ